MIKKESRNPWLWVPSIYFAEGLPYVMVIVVSTAMYVKMGIPNSEMTFYTGWLYLPWVIKPLWSPVVDLLKTKRYWIIIMQFLVGAGLAGVALTIPADNFFKYTLAFFWLIAFSSATHDIAIDGFYMLGLDDHQQAWFVGVRTTLYRIAFIFGQGLLVIIAGQFEISTGDIPQAWSIIFFIVVGIFILLLIYHVFILPFPKSDSKRTSNDYKAFFSEYFKTFIIFFKKKNILIIIAFILLFRLGEAQLAKISTPFLLNGKDVGGLALTTSQYGFVYGTVGFIALTIGGLIGGFVAAKQGLKYWIWWMLVAINLPDLVYVYLSFSQTTSLLMINIMVAIEQFGYGFGFTAFLLVLIYISEGDHKTAHYAIATGLMALGMMIPGMISGWIQSILGYKYFFIWVTLSTIPAFIITRFIRIDPDFGKKTNGK